MPQRLPWLSLMSMPLLLWGMPVEPGQQRPNQIKQNTADSPAILQVEGALTDSDSTLSDDSHYDEYFFEGQTGQIIKITLESDEFDTYLLLESPTGERIADNDDGGDGTNAQIVVQFLESGRY